MCLTGLAARLTLPSARDGRAIQIRSTNRSILRTKCVNVRERRKSPCIPEGNTRSRKVRTGNAVRRETNISIYYENTRPKRSAELDGDNG